MIVLITSTSKDLYKRDMLNVCCKLTDDLISFSYNKDWIFSTPKKTGNNAQASVPPSLKGQNALIVFAEYKPASPKFNFRPIRFCSIVEAVDNIENASFTYHLKLGDCIEYKYAASNPQVNDAFVNAFDSEFKAQYTAGESEDVLKLYVREMNFTTPYTAAPLEKTGVWPNLVKHLGNLDVFKECVFFRQVVQKNGIDFRDMDLRNIKPIELAQGSPYNLNFLAIAGRDVKGSGIYPAIETSTNISVQGPFISQESNAVALKYVLVTKTSTSALFSGFLMKASVKDVTTPISPEINRYIKLKPRKFVLLALYIFIGLGLIVSNISDLIPKNKLIELFWIYEVESNTLITAIKLIAAVIIAYGTFVVGRGTKSE